MHCFDIASVVYIVVFSAVIPVPCYETGNKEKRKISVAESVRAAELRVVGSIPGDRTLSSSFFTTC